MINTFNNLTQQNSIDLNETILNQFLYNIVPKSNTIQNKRISTFFQDNVKKNSYNANDFNQLNIKWDGRAENITSSIGHKLVIKNNYPLVANPFNNNIIDPIIDREINNIVSTQNSYLLFKYFPILNNNIYLCTAENVINYAETNQLNPQYFLKLYFPNLFRTVKTKDILISSRLQRYNKQKGNVNKYFKKINDKIDLFYDILNSGQTLEYYKVGIKYCNINIHSINNVKLPLEVLFKIIHSNENIPLIKYNPGINYENIYRLYTADFKSVSGIKVPHLYVVYNMKKSKIVNISKVLAKKTSIGFYINSKYKKQPIEIYCEIYENGTINVKFETNELLLKSDIENIIKKFVNNTVVKKVRDYLKQSGYTYTDFDNLLEENIEIVNLTYNLFLKIKRK